MGRVSKRGATTSWDANHAALYQRGFRDLQWDPLETKGPAIKAIIEEAISADSAFETLRWLFSKASRGGRRTATVAFTITTRRKLVSILHSSPALAFEVCVACLLFHALASFFYHLSPCRPLSCLSPQESSSRTVLFRVDELLLVSTGTAPTTATGRILTTAAKKTTGRILTTAAKKTTATTTHHPQESW